MVCFIVEEHFMGIASSCTRALATWFQVGFQLAITKKQENQDGRSVDFAHRNVDAKAP
jgi:hypothetical protein